MAIAIGGVPRPSRRLTKNEPLAKKMGAARWRQPRGLFVGAQRFGIGIEAAVAGPMPPEGGVTPWAASR